MTIAKAAKKEDVSTVDQPTRDYVDQSIDAQRQYAENLFGKAASRVANDVLAKIDAQIEARFKKALETIRPTANAIDLQVPLSQRNWLAYDTLRKRVLEAVTEYQTESGLLVRYIAVDNRVQTLDRIINVRPIIANV
jgi:hypothetical protein